MHTFIWRKINYCEHIFLKMIIYVAYKNELKKIIFLSTKIREMKAIGKMTRTISSRKHEASNIVMHYIREQFS